jgi:hypothetical protein
MVDGEVATLLLSAAGRHESEPTGGDPLGDLLVGQVTVLHAPPLLLKQCLMGAHVSHSVAGRRHRDNTLVPFAVLTLAAYLTDACANG